MKRQSWSICRFIHITRYLYDVHTYNLNKDIIPRTLYIMLIKITSPLLFCIKYMDAFKMEHTEKTCQTHSSVTGGYRKRIRTGLLYYKHKLYITAI